MLADTVHLFVKCYENVQNNGVLTQVISIEKKIKKYIPQLDMDQPVYNFTQCCIYYFTNNETWYEMDERSTAKEKKSLTQLVLL